MRLAGALVARRLPADLTPVALLLVLALLFLWPVILGGKALLPADNLYSSPPWSANAARFGIAAPHNELIGDMVLQNYSWKALAKESYLAGAFPLWNPYIFAGMPFLAQGQYGALYPPNVLFLALPVAQAYGWFTALHLLLGGLFTYLFLRVLGSGRFGALVSGIGFMLCGFLVVSLLWPQMVSTAIWLPLLLTSIEMVLRKLAPEDGQPAQSSAALLWAMLGAATVGLQFLAGHMEISFYLLSTALVYAGARLAGLAIRRRRLARPMLVGLGLFAMVALGFGLAAGQLLPFVELIQQNYRAGSVTYQEVIGWALPKRQVLAFLMPDIFGNPTHHSYFDLIERAYRPITGVQDAAGQPRDYPFWGIKNYVEGTAYVGILPLLLAGVALALRRDRFTRLFAGYALFSLFLAFGGPLYAVFFYGIPGFDQLHSPFRWVYPYSFSLLVLAGLGADALLHHGRDHPDADSKSVGIVRAIASLILVGGAALLLLLAMSLLFSGTAQAQAEALRRSSHALAFAFGSGRMLFSYVFPQVLRLALLLVISALMVRLGLSGLEGRRRDLWMGGALGLLILDLFSFGFTFNTASDPELVEFTPPALAFLQADREPFRIVTFGEQAVLKPNSGMLAGLQDARGYDTVIPRRYVEYWRLLEEPSGLLYSQINRLAEAESLGSPLLDLLNVKYVLTLDEIRSPNFTEVYRGELNIYRNEDVLPRAFAVFQGVSARDGEEARALLARPFFDPRRAVILEGQSPLALLASAEPTESIPAQVQGYRTNEVVVEVAMPQEGYLVLADAYFAGWRAFLGDREMPVLRADYLFRAVRLPAGQHRVVFRYAPDSFKIGMYVSLLSGILLLLGFSIGAWGYLYREAEATSGVRRVVKNSLTPMAAQVVNRLMDFGFTVFMLRLLGPASYGNYAIAVVIIGYFSIFVEYGLGTLLTRDVAKDRSQANRFFINVMVVRLVLVLAALPVLLALLALYYRFFALPEEAVLAVLLFMVSIIPSSVAGAASSVFSAHERMEYPAAVTVITSLLRVSLGVGALLLGWGVVGLAGVSVVVSTITALLLLGLLMATLLRPRIEVDLAFSGGLVRASTPLMFNNFLSSIFFRVDIMLLQPMKGNEAVGYYSTAYKFLDGLNVIPSFFTLAIFPVLSRYAESSRERLLQAYAQALKALVIIAVPITVGITLTADRLVLFFFGPEFAPAIRALQVLIWFLPFSYMNSVTQYVLIAVNQQRFLTLAFVIGASFNLAANLLVIPVYGLQGAAVVTVLSELVLMVPFFYAVARHVGKVPLLGLLGRPFLAIVVMGLLLFPLRHLSPLWLFPLGGLTYGLLLLALRTFDDQDWAVLRALWAR